MNLKPGAGLALAVVLSACAGNSVCEGECLTKQGLPAPVKRVEPTYPQLALDAQVSGCTTVSFNISPEGKPEKLQVIESRPPTVFNDSSLKALEQWRFAPTDKGGRWAQVLEYRIDKTSTFDLGCVAPAYDVLNGPNSGKKN